MEIICINDSSTGDSLSVIKKYAQIDSRICILDKVNERVSIARNEGLKASTGEYVCGVHPLCLE